MSAKGGRGHAASRPLFRGQGENGPAVYGARFWWRRTALTVHKAAHYVCLAYFAEAYQRASTYALALAQGFPNESIGEGWPGRIGPPSASRPLLASLDARQGSEWPATAFSEPLGLCLAWVFAAEVSQCLPPNWRWKGITPNESVGGVWLGLGPKL